MGSSCGGGFFAAGSSLATGRVEAGSFSASSLLSTLSRRSESSPTSRSSLVLYSTSETARFSWERLRPWVDSSATSCSAEVDFVAPTGCLAAREYTPASAGPARPTRTLPASAALSPGEVIACLNSSSFWKAASLSFFSPSVSVRSSSVSSMPAVTSRTVLRNIPRNPPLFTGRCDRIAASGPRRSRAVRKASASSPASKVI